MTKDGNGYITIEEVRNILDQSREISEAQWKKIVGKIDSNNDGKISFEEFVSMMKQL